MPFDLEILDEVDAYLESDDCHLSDYGREMIADTLEFIENLTDEWRADPINRIPAAPPSYAFLRHSHLWTEGDGRVYCISFIIDDRPAVHGILRIPYADYAVSDQILPQDP